LGFALRVATGRWRSDPEVTEYAAPFLTIRRRGKAMQVMNDGELMLLEPPLKYRCRTRALVVLAAP
jgi:diacylglycerol kinase family enzyme